MASDLPRSRPARRAWPMSRGGTRTTSSAAQDHGRSSAAGDVAPVLQGHAHRSAQALEPAHETLMAPAAGGHGAARRATRRCRHRRPRRCATSCVGLHRLRSPLVLPSSTHRLAKRRTASGQASVGALPRSYQVTLALLAEATGDTTRGGQPESGDTQPRSQPAASSRLSRRAVTSSGPHHEPDTEAQATPGGGHQAGGPVASRPVARIRASSPHGRAPQPRPSRTARAARS